MQLINKIKAILIDIEQPESNEDFDIYSDSGANYDDAYSMGVDHGEKWGEYSLAQKILKIIQEG